MAGTLMEPHHGGRQAQRCLFLIYTDAGRAHVHKSYERYRDQFEYKLKYHFGAGILEDSFTIPLIEYDAAPFVDILPKKS